MEAQTPQSGLHLYRYTVVNGSRFPITDVLIGEDYVLGADEIAYPPVGSLEDSMPSTSYKSPPGWRFRSIRVEEDSVGYVTWDILDEGAAIQGGTTVGGFEVLVDELDPAYTEGHWTVYLNSTEEPLYTGGLQPYDKYKANPSDH